MKVTGGQIRCMVKACSLGQTDANTLVSTETTRRRGTASLFGPMVDVIVVNGLMESKMAKVLMYQVVAKKNMASGKMGRGLDGLVVLRVNDLS